MVSLEESQRVIEVGNEPDNNEIAPFLNISNSEPLEAKDNIEKAKDFDITPEAYKQLKPHLKEEEPIPENVQRRMVQSTEHASIMKQDTGLFNSIRKQVNFTVDTMRERSTSRELMRLQFDRLWNGKSGDPDLDDLIDMDIADLNNRLSQMNVREDYGFDFTQSVPGEVANFVYDFGLGVWEERDTVIGATLLGVGGGATIGGILGGGIFSLPGALVGAKVGGLKGVSLGTGAAAMVDIFKQSSGQLYNHALFAMEDASQLAEDERRAIAVGGGVLTAGIGFVPLRTIARNVPWMNKILNPSRYMEYVMSSQGSKMRQLSIAMGKVILAGGSTEVVQELISTTAMKLADTWDGSETSYLKAFEEVLKDRGEIIPKLGESFVIGGLGSAAIAGAGRAVGPVADLAIGDRVDRTQPESMDAPLPVPDAPPVQEAPSDISGIDNVNVPVEKAAASVRLKMSIDQVAQLVNQTKTNELLPSEIDAIIRENFNDNDMSHVYMERTEANAWADTQEKADGIGQYLDADKMAEAELDAPIAIPIEEAVRLTTQFPDVSNLFKPFAEGPSTRAWLMEQKRLSDTQDTETNLDNQDVFGEQNYTEQVTFQGEQVSGEEASSNTKLNTAKEALVKDLRDSNDLEISKLSNLYEEQAMVMMRESTVDEINSNPNIKLVDGFLNNTTTLGEISDAQQARMKKGKPIYAIKPETLTESQRQAYLNDPVLKRRSVFDKNGVDARQVAEIFGKPSVESLLNTLRDSPTREQAVSRYRENVKADENIDARAMKNVKDAKFMKSYSDVTNAHLDQAAIIAKRANLQIDVPNADTLKADAQQKIGSTVVKYLNPTQWKVGERKSQSKVSRSLEAGDASAAFEAKVKAAFNSQLAAQTHQSIGKVNAALKWVSRLKTKRMQNILKAAGPKYQNAVNHLLDHFGFDLDIRDQTQRSDYDSFVQAMLKENKGDFSIPDNAFMWSDTQPRPQDLTVDQVMYLTDMMKKIVRQAKMQGQFHVGPIDGFDTTTLDIIRDVLNSEAINHPDYNESRVNESVRPITVGEKVGAFLGKAGTLAKNTQFIAQQLDKGVFNGAFSKAIYQRLDGSGIHAESGEGVAGKISIQVEMRQRIKEGINKYGRREFANLANQMVVVPEFAGITALRDGKLSKSELMMMLANMGNPENMKALENYQVSAETMMDVLKREMSVKDFDFVQESIWGTFAQYKDRLAALVLDTEGRELDFVELKPFKAFGKDFEGGYLPLKYVYNTKVDAVSREMQALYESADPSKTSIFVPTTAYEGVVRSPHTKDRVGSDWHVDLDFSVITRSFDELAHDLAMRRPLRDTMTILKDNEIKRDIISIVGRERYNLMVNEVAAMTKNMPSINGYSTQRKFLDGMVKYIEGAVVPIYLAYNLGTVVINTITGLQVLSKMEFKSGMKHMSLVSSKLPFKWNEMRAFAEEVDSSLKGFSEGMEVYTGNLLADVIPKKRVKGFSLLARGRDAANRFALNGLLGTVDMAIKTITINAAYNQFKAGEAPGWSMDRIMKMSPEEVHVQAKAYAAQMSQSTTMSVRELDKAPLQKIELGQIMARFWNEPRNALNNREQDFRNTKYDIKAMIEKSQDGDYVGANMAFESALDRSMRVIVMTAVSVAIFNLARGRDFGVEEDDIVEDLSAGQQLEQMLYWMAYRTLTPGGVAKTFADGVLTNVPVVRDLFYTGQTGQAVTFPLTSMLTDVGRTGHAAYETYQNIQLGLSLAEALESLDNRQRRAVLNATSLALGGFPVNGPLKIYSWYEEFMENPPPLDLSRSREAAVQALDRFIDRFDDADAKELEAFEAALRDEGESNLEDAVKQAKALRAEILGVRDGADVLTSEEFDLIKFAESSGNWRASPPGSSAFGLYQFTRGTWEEVMNSPEGAIAGLTMSGWTSSNPDQQEAAMRIFTSWNAQALLDVGVSPTLETIYFAHHFGRGAVKKYASHIFTKSENRALPKGFLTASIKAANPALVQRNVRTIGDFRKYLQWNLDRGRRELELSRR